MLAHKVIRIGGASAFWGDSIHGPQQLVRRADVEYLVLNYLAELTISNLVRATRKNPELGYATDFVVDAMRATLVNGAEKPIGVIANAGAVNSAGCARALAALAKESGVHISVIEGDDLMGRVDALRAMGMQPMITGAPLPEAVAGFDAYPEADCSHGRRRSRLRELPRVDLSLVAPVSQGLVICYITEQELGLPKSYWAMHAAPRTFAALAWRCCPDQLALEQESVAAVHGPPDVQNPPVRVEEDALYARDGRRKAKAERLRLCNVSDRNRYALAYGRERRCRGGAYQSRQLRVQLRTLRKSAIQGTGHIDVRDAIRNSCFTVDLANLRVASRSSAHSCYRSGQTRSLVSRQYGHRILRYRLERFHESWKQRACCFACTDDDSPATAVTGQQPVCHQQHDRLPDTHARDAVLPAQCVECGNLMADRPLTADDPTAQHAREVRVERGAGLPNKPRRGHAEMVAVPWKQQRCQ